MYVALFVVVIYIMLAYVVHIFIVLSLDTGGTNSNKAAPAVSARKLEDEDGEVKSMFNIMP